MLPIDETAVDLIIEGIMRPICPAVWKNICRETPLPEEYIVHDVEDDNPEEYAGDRDIGMTYYRRIHLYTKWNPQEKAKRIRQALRQAGFTITGNMELDDPAGYTHKIVFAYIQGNLAE